MNLTNSQTNENDLKDYKFGYEYSYSDTFKLRFGYVISSAVTNKNYTSDLSTPPSEIHHKMIGFGKTWNLDNDRYLEFNMAFDNYYGKGSGSTENRKSVS